MILIQCERDKTTKITNTTCVARQRVLKNENRKNGWVARQFRDCENSCSGCKTGLELYQKHLNGKLSMDVQTKKCPCGVTITRHPEQGVASWGRVKYCPEHAAMSAYQRGKFFKDSKKEPAKAVKLVPTPKKDPKFLPVKPDLEEDKKTFVCKLCGQEKELTLKNFHSNKSHKTGFDSKCKICRANVKKLNRGTKQGCVVLDFSEHAELLEKTKTWAKKNFRRVDQQILAHLSKHFGKVV